MFVNFEFLDSEPLDNVVTSLNYRFDKTVFFGYSDIIAKQSETLSGFLSRYCEKQQTEFITVPRNKLKETLSIMREAVGREKSEGHVVFFDVTGGEAIPLVAFGILSTELDTPMHIFNVKTNKLKEQEEGADEEISLQVPRHEVEFDVDALIKLMGGAVDKESRKSNKLLDNEDQVREAHRMISMFKNHTGEWGRITSVFRSSICSDGDGYYHIDYAKTADHFYPAMVGRLKSFLSEMVSCGLAEMFSDDDGEKHFRFSSEFVHMNMTEEGAVLELMTCLELREEYKYAQAGVKVDWSGAPGDGNDVENEVDVIALDGFVPIIVSCKCGNQANKDALYELDTVARRFGGRYARKILVSAKNMMPADLERAREMDIEVRIIDKTKKVKKYD